MKALIVILLIVGIIFFIFGGLTTLSMKLILKDPDKAIDEYEKDHGGLPCPRETFIEVVGKAKYYGFILFIVGILFTTVAILAMVL